MNARRQIHGGTGIPRTQTAECTALLGDDKDVSFRMCEAISDYGILCKNAVLVFRSQQALVSYLDCPTVVLSGVCVSFGYFSKDEWFLKQPHSEIGSFDLPRRLGQLQRSLHLVI